MRKLFRITFGVGLYHTLGSDNRAARVPLRIWASRRPRRQAISVDFLLSRGGAGQGMMRIRSNDLAQQSVRS